MAPLSQHKLEPLIPKNHNITIYTEEKTTQSTLNCRSEDRTL